MNELIMNETNIFGTDDFELMKNLVLEPVPAVNELLVNSNSIVSDWADTFNSGELPNLTLNEAILPSGPGGIILHPLQQNSDLEIFNPGEYTLLDTLGSQLGVDDGLVTPEPLYEDTEIMSGGGFNNLSFAPFQQSAILAADEGPVLDLSKATATTIVTKKHDDDKIIKLEHTTKKVNRKRNSISESSSAPETKESKRGKKKKLYEHPNKSDPKVVRAEYAKSYREKLKVKTLELQTKLEKSDEEHQKTRKELQRSQDEVQNLERRTLEHEAMIRSLQTENNQKNDKIVRLEKQLKVEKEKNSLNSTESKKLVEKFAGVVEAFRKGSRPMALIVSERIANKKVYDLTEEEVQDICTNAGLEKHAITIRFDEDETGKGFIAKKPC